MNIHQIFFYISGLLLTLYYELVNLSYKTYDPCSGLKESIHNFSLININNHHDNKFLRVASVRENFFKRHSFLIILKFNNDKKFKYYETVGLYRKNRTNLIFSPDYFYRNCTNKTSELYFHTDWVPIYSTDYLLDLYLDNITKNISKYRNYNSADFVLDLFNKLSISKLDCKWKFGINLPKYCHEIR
jgi:hypothetical protein